MTRRKVLTAVALVLLAGGVAVAIDRSTSRPANGAARVLGPVSPNRVMNVSLVLRLPRRQALDRFLAACADPSSRRYRQTLSPTAFGVRSGHSQVRIAALTRALKVHGLTVTSSYPQRTALRAIGTAAVLGQAFATQLQERLDPHGPTISKHCATRG